VAATWSQCPWGENRRPQDGAAALIDDPQPADRLPRLEADALSGVDLPDVMGLGSAGGAAGGTAAGGGRGQVGGVDPALHGALARDGGGGVFAAQQQAEQAGAPGGMLAAQLPRSFAHGGGRRGQRPARAPVAWRHAGAAVSLPVA
jgi:hypothetical protein